MISKLCDRAWMGTCLVLLALLLQTGCAVNPVTGERELMLVSEAQEFAIGREQYEPAQQAQGGRYYLDPELTLYIQEVGQKLARVSDRPDLPYEFVVLNNSVPNAWALPSGKIAINRGLLVELEDEAQLAAVLGHEIVHAAARHSAKRMQSGMLVSAGMAGLGVALKDKSYSDLLIGGAALGANMTMAKYGRDHELESDHYGMTYMARAGYEPEAAMELQQTFVRLSEGRRTDWLSGLLASHPPSQERVEANRVTARKLPGDYRGREAYQKATARLRKTLPAYEAHDEGRALLEKEQYKEALAKANQAIRIEPDEALFYALRGEAHKGLGSDRQALADFDKAVALNPEYFANFLNRGMANQEAGNTRQAEKDLAAANSLLPTSMASLALGSLAEQSGQTDAALGHYRAAAQATGEFGNQARLSVARLDFPNNPGEYLPVKIVQDRQGRRYVQLQNQSPLDLQTVALELKVLDRQGNLLSEETLTFREVKAGGASDPALSRSATDASRLKDVKLVTRIAGYTQ